MTTKTDRKGLFSPRVRDALRRRPRLSLPQWAEEYRFVSGGPYPGRWRNDTFPPQAEIMAAFDDDNIRRVVVAACVRSGKTEVALINPMLRALLRGEPVLYMTTTDTLAENTWRQKILPALRSHPELRQLLLGVRDAGDSNVRYFSGGGVLHFCTAQSIGKVVGFDAKVILLDEVDKYPQSLRSEASPAELAESRGSAFRDVLKIAEVCTVTNEDGRIWQQFLAGDRRRLLVPCPHCGKWQALHLATNDGLKPANEMNPLQRDGARGGLRWEGVTAQGIERTVHYVCPFCENAIDEAGRRVMVKRARFVPEGMEIGEDQKLHGEPTNPGKTASFWFNDFYLTWSSWSYLAEKVQEAESKEDADKARSIVQQYLALPWREGAMLGATEVSAAGVMDKLSGVPQGVVPEDADKLVMFIDVGAHRIWWLVTAWGYGARGYIIDRGVEDVYGAPEGNLAQQHITRQARIALERAVLAVLRDVRDRIAQRPYTREDGTQVDLSLTLIDAGYLDNVVLHFTGESGQNRYMASRGYGAGHALGRKPTGNSKTRMSGNHWAVTLLEDKKHVMFHYDANFWKSFVHLRLTAPVGASGSLELYGKSRRKHFDLAKHLTSEEYNIEKGVWENRRRRANHWFDCLAGCCAGADMRGRGIFSSRPEEKKEEKKDG